MSIFNETLDNIMTFLDLKADSLCTAMDTVLQQRSNADKDAKAVDPSAVRHWRNRTRPARPSEVNFICLCDGIVIVCNGIEEGQKGRAIAIALKRTRFLSTQGAIFRENGAPNVEWDNDKSMGENIRIFLEIAYYFRNDYQNCANG